MAIVSVKKPEIITFTYKQEKTDEDYGTCFWARFNLDTENYTLSIESDCGSYSYSWIPTTNSESFLHLCCRINQQYLLEKLSNKKVVNQEDTWKAICDVINNNDIDTENLDLSYAKSVCFSYANPKELYDELAYVLSHLGLKELFDSETLLNCITNDYPCGAKKIVEIFFEHIVPKIREYEATTANNGDITRRI